MKQNISLSQLNELSDKGKERLRECMDIEPGIYGTTVILPTSGMTSVSKEMKRLLQKVLRPSYAKKNGAGERTTTAARDRK